MTRAPDVRNLLAFLVLSFIVGCGIWFVDKYSNGT
jgi:hypothetical protein